MERPIAFVLRLCRVNNTPAYRHLSRSLEYDTVTNPFSRLANKVAEKRANSTKVDTYMSELNPSMDAHPVHTATEFIPDHLRMAFSRLRLMSHNLKIETGRWSRIPREERTCRCNNTSIQTKSHVLIECHLTQDLRGRFPNLNFRDSTSLLDTTTNLHTLCKYIHEVITFFR